MRLSPYEIDQKQLQVLNVGFEWRLFQVHDARRLFAKNKDKIDDEDDELDERDERSTEPNPRQPAQIARPLRKTAKACNGAFE